MAHLTLFEILYILVKFCFQNFLQYVNCCRQLPQYLLQNSSKCVYQFKIDPECLYPVNKAMFASRFGKKAADQILKETSFYSMICTISLKWANRNHKLSKNRKLNNTLKSNFLCNVPWLVRIFLTWACLIRYECAKKLFFGSHRVLWKRGWKLFTA